MFSVKQVLQTGKLFLEKNSPVILTAAGVAGVVTTAVLAVRAQRAAEDLVHSDWDGDEIPTQLDYVRQGWKFYIPPVAVGLFTISCIVGAQSINTRRNAALLSLYTLSEKAFKDLQETVVEDLGEGKFASFRDKIAQKTLDENPISSTREVYLTGKGDTLCYDTLSGRYFKSDIERIKKAQNDLNYRLVNGTWCTLNEFYELLGLASIDLGDEVGWIPDDLLELYFSAMLADDNTPCIVVNFHIKPKVNYYCR